MVQLSTGGPASSCRSWTGPLLRRAQDLTGRRNGRSSIEEDKIYFIEQIPLALKNHVKSVASNKNAEKSCTKEMMELIGCLEQFNKDQSMCVKEINKFNQCFTKFRQFQAEQKALKEKGQLPRGPNAKFSGDQMKEYFKKFPQSSRTKREYIHPEFKKSHKES